MADVGGQVDGRAHGYTTSIREQKVSFRTAGSRSDSTRDGPEVVVQPGEHFLHDLCTIDHDVVCRVVKDVAVMRVS